MHFVAPDILTDGQGFSLVACGIGLGVGAFVWLLGGLSYRFWIVLLTTLGAGVYGLSIGEAFGVQPPVSALLLAIAGGLLALALSRVGAFLAGGVVLSALAERMLGWNEPFVFFFAGGFLGLLLLRFWFMVLSSLGGTLIMAYSLLWLLESLGKLDASAFAASKPVLLNWACGGVTLLGLLIQIGIVRRFRPKTRNEKDDEEEEERRGRGPTGIIRWFSSSSSRRGRRAA